MCSHVVRCRAQKIHQSHQTRYHSIDFHAVMLEHECLLTNYRQEWAERFERDSDHTGLTPTT